MKRIILAIFLTFSLAACSPQEIIATVFPGEVTKAYRVVECESEWNQYAVNPTSGASGFFQIHPFWNKPGHPDPVADYIGRNWHRRFDPVQNVIMAKMIRDTPRGWGHWECK